jgi:rRNA processing protein Krr1/Pno1
MKKTIDRNTEIRKIAVKIQKEIDKLKKLNCSIDSSYNSISVFDNTIEPIIHKGGDGDDFSKCIVFSFDTAG